MQRYRVVEETRGEQVGRLHVRPDAAPAATLCGLPIDDDGDGDPGQRAIRELAGGGDVTWVDTGYRCIRCATRYGQQRGQLEG